MSIESVLYDNCGWKYRNSYKNGFDLTATTLLQRWRLDTNMNSPHCKTCCESYVRYTDLSAMQQFR